MWWNSTHFHKSWVIRENSAPGRKYRSQNLMKYTTFTASREIHPCVRFQLFSTFSHKNMKIHYFHRNFKKNHDSTWKSPEIRLLYLKTPKNPIGLIDVFSPRPAGAPLLPKSTKFHPISPKWRWNPLKSPQIMFWGGGIEESHKFVKSGLKSIRGVAKSEGWFSRNHMKIQKIPWKWRKFTEFL